MGLTAKQERFAHLLVALGNASEAYRQAYDAKNMSGAAINTEAWRLRQHPEIALRIGALRAAMADGCRVTVESLVDELERARKSAMINRQAAAAVSASMAKARLLGLLITRTELVRASQAPKPNLSELLAQAKVD